MRLAIAMAATALILAACGRSADGPVLYEVRSQVVTAPVIADPQP